VKTWFTVDTDDLRHLPVHQGHPTRSKKPFTGSPDRMSERFQQGWTGFHRWMATHDHAVTVFLITDLLEDPAFVRMFKETLRTYGNRITVGCHGHTHRSWSAWGEDRTGFEAMLARSQAHLASCAEGHVQPWFRAPAGYVAGWMADGLAKHAFTVDSSVNPSLLVRSKTNGEGWASVTAAMERAGVMERPWFTSWGMPANGPALFRFPLSVVARRAWRRLPPPLKVEEMDLVAQPDANVITAYVHVLDFARNNGTWTPPLPRHHP